MGVSEIFKKLLGKEDEDEFRLELSSSDGCVGEELIQKLIEKLKPC